MSAIPCENAQKFKQIIGKLPEDIFKEVCSYALPSKKEYIFRHYERSYVLKEFNTQIESNLDIIYQREKRISNLKKEKNILFNLINNELPYTEEDYPTTWKIVMENIIKIIFPKNIFLSKNKINQIISVYVNNIDILDINKNIKIKIENILLLKKIRNYKLISSRWFS